MHLLLLSARADGDVSVMPALLSLDHRITARRLELASLNTSGVDVVVIDATDDLAAAALVCRLAATDEVAHPVLVVLDDSALPALKATWGFDDWLLSRAQPAEVETRLRLLVERARGTRRGRAASVGGLSIDEDTYVVRLRDRPLDLTYREFELLKYLAANPGRVFTRGQLLQEVWGYDYFGGTRTVDVHIRRLRAKLGPEYEGMIGTVRGVGYKLDPEGAVDIDH